MAAMLRSYPDLLLNPNFECGYSSGLEFKGHYQAPATLSDRNHRAYNGDSAAKMSVETANGITK